MLEDFSTAIKESAKPFDPDQEISEDLLDIVREYSETPPKTLRDCAKILDGRGKLDLF